MSTSPLQARMLKMRAFNSAGQGTSANTKIANVFGANRPSNKKVLEDLREEITQAGEDNTKAEAIIDRICTHSDSDFAVERYNQQLESRYNLTNVKLLSGKQEIKATAQLALNWNAPIIAAR